VAAHSSDGGDGLGKVSAGRKRGESALVLPQNQIARESINPPPPADTTTTTLAANGAACACAQTSTTLNPYILQSSHCSRNVLQLSTSPSLRNSHHNVNRTTRYSSQIFNHLNYP